MGLGLLGGGDELVVDAAGAGFVEEEDEFRFGLDDGKGGGITGVFEVLLEGFGEEDAGGVFGQIVHEGGGGDGMVAGFEDGAPAGFLLKKHG